jgi:competence protein CoiA
MNEREALTVLIALDEKDQPLYAEQAQKRIRMNAGGTYYCPCCKGRVMFKSGEYMSAHFAHYHAENCAAFTEGETAAHLKGKRMLLEKFRVEGLPVLLESWLPELTQRPDLLIRPESGKPIAIEYQCSPIAFAELKGRTEGYRQNGYHVWWICGMDYQPRHLTQKIFQFLNHSNEGGCWFSLLDSEREELQLCHNFRISGTNQLTFDKAVFPLCGLPFPVLERLFNKGEFPPTFDPKKKGRTAGGKRTYMQPKDINLLRYRTDLEHKKFLLKIYLNREALHQLPALLFEYPFHSLSFITPAYIWGYYLLQEIVALGENASFTKQDVLKWIRQFLASKMIRKRETVFMKEENGWASVLPFLKRLEGEQYLVAVGENQWLLLKLPEKGKTNCLFQNLQ